MLQGLKKKKEKKLGKGHSRVNWVSHLREAGDCLGFTPLPVRTDQGPFSEIEHVPLQSPTNTPEVIFP